MWFQAGAVFPQCIYASEGMRRVSAHTDYLYFYRKEDKMKISAKGVYAIEIMLDILEYGSRTPVAIKDVAARRDISGKYAEQVVGILSFAGLVRSARGPKDGYCATEAARTATVGTILRLTETVLKEQNQDQESAGLSYVIQDLDHAIDEVLDRYTLVHVLDLMHDSGDNYVI